MFAVLILLTFACNLSNVAGNADEDVLVSTPETSENSDPEPTSAPPTPEMDSENQDSDPVEATEPADDSLTSAAEGLDPCLYGLWTAENESMAAYLENAMNQNGQTDFFSVTDITGILQMSFDDAGEMGMYSEDYLIPVAISFSEEVSMDLLIELRATGTADYTADGAVLENRNTNLEVSGNPLDSVLTAVAEGESTIIMDVNPDWFLGTITEDAGTDSGTAIYTCSESTFTLQTTEYGVVEFSRTE